MKYIRTPDRIYKVPNEKVIRKDENGNFYVKVKHWQYDHRVPCVQADTIEELCDAFIVSFEDEQYELGLPRVEMFCTLEVAKEIAKAEGNGKVYGAIWTRKGLILEILFDGKEEEKIEVFL